MSRIEWTETTWNPTTGCDRVSPGCDHCYALTMAKRLKGMGSAKYQRDGDPRTSGPGFGVTEHPDTLGEPLGWRKPRRVFVNSMSDLFHDAVPDVFIARVFAVMALAPQHTFQVLTKRHGRMRSLLTSAVMGELFGRAVQEWITHNGVGRVQLQWPLPNVWLGVTAENQRWADIRIPVLLDTPAAVRFVSAEPLLGSLNLATEWADLDWVIVGGESGPGAQPMDLAWARNLVNDCRALGIAPFVKQLGSVWASASGWGGKGGLPEQWPADLRVREFPQAVAA